MQRTAFSLCANIVPAMLAAERTYARVGGAVARRYEHVNVGGETGNARQGKESQQRAARSAREQSRGNARLLLRLSC